MPDASTQLCDQTSVAAGMVGGVTRTVFPQGRANSSAKVRSGLVQVDIGVATINIEGRSSATASWFVIATFTASGAQAVELFFEMRANVTAYTSGAAKAWLGQ